MTLSFCKTILINVTVFCSLFVSLEISYRLWMYPWSCDNCNNTASLAKLDAFNRYTVYGFLAPDPITGFSPTDGTFGIREPGWNDATITIRQGVRINPNFTPALTDGAILAVGDSYVFGDQVSDNETWPSILEQRLNRLVVNGGVSNYGTAQAVLRAEQLLKARPYKLVILSILVDTDLWRARLVNGFIFYRPAIIRENGKLRETTIEDSRRIVSGKFICAHPWIPELFFWSYIAKSFFGFLGYDGHCKEMLHPKAAGIDEIVEFAVDRLAAFSVNTAILLQYQQFSFNAGRDYAIYEAQMIRQAASRHGVPVIDTYSVLDNQLMNEIYKSAHHSKKGNEIVADLIARKISMLSNGETKMLPCAECGSH
jgi:hypothetical protein